MAWKLHDDVTLDEIREHLAADGYPTSCAYVVLRAWVDGRLTWTAARLTITGKDACDLRPDDAPLCGHSPRGRT